MPNYISLLRGINVAGQKKIKMADLRAHYEAIKFTDVQSYIQSGNLLFNSKSNDEAAVAKKILSKIKKEYSFDVPIFITTEKALKKVVRNNPFLKKSDFDISKMYVTFMSESPDKTLIKALPIHESVDDEYIIDKQTIYLYCSPKGYGKTKLSNNFFEKKLKVQCTTRNWKTLNKLIEMSED